MSLGTLFEIRFPNCYGIWKVTTNLPHSQNNLDEETYYQLELRLNQTQGNSPGPCWHGSCVIEHGWTGMQLDNRSQEATRDFRSSDAYVTTIASVACHHRGENRKISIVLRPIATMSRTNSSRKHHYSHSGGHFEYRS
jgi:hypothetical protein